jgi:dihydrofolate reductase / thymidylate synthase
MQNFSIIVAATQKGGIGCKNSIPWRLKPDMDYFKTITTDCKDGMKNAVIMGRKTWESIPPKFRPLPGRHNIVLSRLPHEVPGVEYHESLKDAFYSLMHTQSNIEKIFIIGGASLYAEALHSPYCERVYLTNIFNDFPECDTFFPPIDHTRFVLDYIGPIQHEKTINFQFVSYIRKHEECQYLDVLRDTILTGNRKGDRTGTGVLSHFGRTMMRFSLRNNTIPLLTTKEIFWRGVVEELLWLIKGSTDAKELSTKRVKIWDGNGTRDFLDKAGFRDREVGDLGPIYGHQWRHYGAPYINCTTDYTGQGIDQIRNVIHTIKTNPTDRRMIVCAWNVAALPEMALPPCHLLFQFYVYDGELSCCMYQRSGDCGLGIPFNIASYSLLTAIIAHVCDLMPGDFIHFIADQHVYTNHIEPLKEQLSRTPRPFPKLNINPGKKDIDNFTFEDFQLIGYDPHPKIKMEMSV